MRVTRVVVEFDDESEVEVDGRFVREDEPARVIFSYPYDGVMGRTYEVSTPLVGDRLEQMIKGVRQLLGREWR